MSQKDSIIQLDFTEEMRNSYRDYAVSVLFSRRSGSGYDTSKERAYCR